MPVLSYCDPKVRRHVKAHRRLRDARVLGRGQFSRVYESRRADRVLKLTLDQSTVAYLTDARAPRGLHKPIVYHNMGVIGTNFRGMPLVLLSWN